MASKLFSTKVIDELSKLREDLNVKSAAPKQESDMGSEALLKDLYGDIMNDSEYDVTQDPAYSGLKKAAYRESDRTMRDVLAQGQRFRNLGRRDGSFTGEGLHDEPVRRQGRGP